MAEKRPSSDAQVEEKPDATGGRPPSPLPTAESSLPTEPGADAAPAVKEDGSEAVELPNSTAGENPAAGEADGRSFSQLLAGAMASPEGSPRARQIVSVPVDSVRLPVVAVPCFLAPAALLESPGFSGQFAMTHQAVLATVTAQAQMQLQASYPSSSTELVSTSVPQPMLSNFGPVSFQQRPLAVCQDSVCTPKTEQLPSSDRKLQSAHIVAKTAISDGYNWRKYGQKQVKSSENSRSYYKCTNTNCFAKRKVERCPDGRIVEIIYRGEHNHDPPQKTKCSQERGAQSGGPNGDNENLELPSREINESDPSACKSEQISGNDTPERQLYCSSDCEGDAGIKPAEDIGEEPDRKRRLIESIMNISTPVLRTVREPKIVVQRACDVGHVSDGYRWRKYGQKIVKGNPNPRSYYRCTHNGCPVRKHVEKASDDAKAMIITYEGKHNHDRPTPQNTSDSPAADLVTAATADTSELLNKSDLLLDQKPSKEMRPDVGGDFSGERAIELGGENALESAQTLLSIGFNSTSGEATRNNSDGVKHPLFSENPAAVPVQNS
ncbi:probable WRKY transcription factor 4 isoform X1 [Phoenix dactylifera]|uniref:Probable WRKY transcription factor 4 isoform X1 n=1 Tax=Phoenix dactylifera TaxID=42345 RepID=A0A8B7MSG0_PHODC|nr:probable WRKY transcription factor 4 isoform X2 [Phoenix dactylifera]XP_038984200.1 probable WRKY transcription factor 4 isoform X1 [Phoenix dactylifera]